MHAGGEGGRGTCMREDGAHAWWGLANMHAGVAKMHAGGKPNTTHHTHITHPHTHTQIHTCTHAHTHTHTPPPPLPASLAMQTQTPPHASAPEPNAGTIPRHPPFPPRTYPDASRRTNPAPSNHLNTHPPAYSYLPSAHALHTPIPLPHPLAQHKR